MARAALFDVDGTLVDTNHLHVVTWWEAFRQAGYDVAMHDVHRAIGLGSDDLVEHLLGKDRDPDEDERLSAAHTALYGTYFERLPPLDGARDLLRELAGRGWRIVLATSAGGPELKALRRAIDADDVIAGVASADDVSEGKPAPDPVHRALELAEADPSEAVFVGDTVWDMKAARSADVRPVALLAGGIARADLEEAGAQAVYGDPAELLTHLDTSVFAQMERGVNP
uniref:HAD family hydrolase n=1 Tax=Streptomyces sp. NBC_00003 TaxID=2903608 RepID=A0AAU2UWW3_9ACTN